MTHCTHQPPPALYPAEQNTAAIVPDSGIDESRAPRFATNRRPSSNPNTPAAWAAANSPRLCPMTTLGSTSDAAPQCGQRALQGIDGRLYPGGVAQVALRAFAAEYDIQQRSTSLLQYDLLTPVENGAYRRLTRVQGLAHTHPLAAPDPCTRKPLSSLLSSPRRRRPLQSPSARRVASLCP